MRCSRGLGRLRRISTLNRGLLYGCSRRGGCLRREGEEGLTIDGGGGRRYGLLNRGRRLWSLISHGVANRLLVRRLHHARC